MTRFERDCIRLAFADAREAVSLLYADSPPPGDFLAVASVSRGEAGCSVRMIDRLAVLERLAGLV